MSALRFVEHIQRVPALVINPPVFSGSHDLIPYLNLHYREAYNRGYYDNDASGYVMDKMVQVYGVDEYLNLMNFIAHQKLEKYSNPLTPLTPRNNLLPQDLNPNNSLTFTTYKYGMLTFQTPTGSNCTEGKISDNEAIQYLESIYNLHFNPNKKTYKGYKVNCWIEKIKDSGFIHMHVVYQGNQWLFVGSGFLKHGIDNRSGKLRPIKYSVHNKPYKCDGNIINACNYAYTDENSEIVKTFEKQISEIL